MRKICIVLSKGGVGKSSSAVSISHSLALLRKKVLLIDTDNQGQDSFLLGVLICVHQFYKVELFVICKNDREESFSWLYKLLQIAEEIMQDLELPYRVIECCTGDMGLGKVRMFDIEAWVASEAKYRETHSCSSFHDWQSRTSNVHYRTSDGVVKFCHTLNNTAIATPRILVPFLENHQQKDGSIYIPLALQPYLEGQEYLSKSLT